MKATNAVLLGIALCATAHGQNIVVNPSFELGAIGWQLGGNVGYDNFPDAASDGDWLMRFNGSDQVAEGVILQVLTTQVGKHYELSFDIAGHTANDMRVEVDVIDAVDDGPQLAESEFQVPVGGAVYTRARLVFTAVSAKSAVYFWDRSLATIGTDLLIDNVSVVPIEGEIPVDINLRTTLRAELEFETTEGITYSVLAATSPAGPFLPVRTLIGDGTTVTFCEGIEIQEQRFYRVVVVE